MRIAWTIRVKNFVRRRLTTCQTRRRIDDLAVAASVLKNAIQKLLKTRAVDNEHRAVGDAAHIVRRRLKTVRLGVQRQQRLNLQTIAGDVLRDIGEKSFGGENLQRTRRGRGARDES